MCDRREGDTRTHTAAHAGAPCGEGGEGGQPLAAAHVYTPGRPGGGRQDSSLPLPPHSKLSVTKARTPVKQHRALSWQRGSSPCSPLLMPGSKNRVSSLGASRRQSQTSTDTALPAFMVKYHPPPPPTLPTLPHPALTLAWSLRFQKANWGFCKPLPLPSGDACSQDKRSNPLLQVPTLRPGVKWLLGH